MEDNDALGQMLRWEFEERGYRVTRAGNCSDAIAALTLSSFDIALIDCDLPDGCGVNLIGYIQRHRPELPVILCSGRITGEQPGAFAFVAKPLDCNQLHRLFQQALKTT